MTQEVLTENQVTEEISDIIVDLVEKVATFSDISDSKALQEYLESYAKHITKIGFRLGKTEHTALRDACVIFREILDNILHKKIEVCDEQLQQLELWPTLVLTQLDSPDNKENIELLLSFLKNPVWGDTINTDDMEQLQNDFFALLPANEQLDESEDETTGAFDGAVFESIQEEVVDAMTGLITDLASTDEDDEFGLSHAFYLCADRIELLGMSIATAGLMGLMDVCMIFQSGLRKLAARETALSDEEQVKIEEWTSHLIAYLSSPTDHEIVENLVDYLNHMPWSDPLTEEEITTLKFMLIPEDIELTAPEGSDDYFYEEIPSEEVQVTENTDELSYEVTGSDELDELSVTEEEYVLGQELIQLIRDEFALEKSSIDDTVNNISSDSTLDDKTVEQLNLFKQMVERFALATESIGLSGLNKLLNHLVTNIDTLLKNDKAHTLDHGIVNFLKQFSTITLNYLNDLDNMNFVEELVIPFFESDWPVKFEYTKDSMLAELHSPQLLIEDDIEIRASTATTEDVSLALPDDVNQQLLNTLLQELPIQTAEFTEAITQLVDGNATLKDVEKAQRIAHTLKGAANTVGVVGIATLTHHIEDIFNVFTEHQRLPGKNLAETLMNAADVLEMMSEALLGLGEEPDHAQSVLQQVLDWANLLDQEGIPEEDAQIKIDKQAEDNTASKDDNSHLNEINAPVMLRIPATLMDELLRIAGESIILGGQLQERLRNAVHQTSLVHEQNKLYQQLVFELEQIVDTQGITAKKSNSNADEVFDSLEMEQYNELHTVTHRLVEAATDSKELTHNIEDELQSLETLMVDQSRLHKENQNIVMQTRMVPVQNIVPRLQRSVRQTARTTCKKVTLDVEGADTMMDSDVLDELVDPIMHILRNAIDHGIENETGREKKNKDLTGKITLSFLRDGDHILVRCVDDGAGLNFNSIRKTAIKKEFITEDQELSEDELTRLIWIAGFTTRDTTTQVSGRGIGMDAVYNQITSLKGTININSEKDKGCTVELRLPLTLISVHAILVKLRKQTIAISNRGIDQILCPGDGELIRESSKYIYKLNDEEYPAYDIETLLHQPTDQRNSDREERSVTLVRDETGKQYAVAVEHIIANQDLIVKQLGSYIPNIIGIEGATILGDGSIAPVIDLPGLIRTAANNDLSPLIEQRLAEANDIEDKLLALVVDDSLSARRSLAEYVKDLGYDVRMARDGIEAIEVIEHQKPDILLVDLEMPRMNGLELTSHIRNKKETKDIPVIMITSRSTEKHREMADSAGVNIYMTKPFAEDELLESIQSLLLSVND